MWFFSPTDLMLLLPAILLSVYAQIKVRSTFAKWSNVPAGRGLSAARLAELLLRDNGISDVDVELVPGELTDHYDPRSRTLRLSESTYHSNSVAALGVAAHECGHAIQHKVAYAPLALRNAIVPVANLGSQLAFPLIFIGLIFSSLRLFDLGILFFSGAVLFHVVTLPVEFNASSRALAQLRSGGYLAPQELAGAREVLQAAALTYVAAAAVAVLQLVRLLMLRQSREN
ncbi:MAG: zinc metallopeptidase [candidate division KSB1 bacterium]|nr:zinc metallopeptidase [candidate division KSB1 bacterium]